MKSLAIVFVSLLSLNALAAQSQADVNAKALEIVLKNSGRIQSQDGEPLSKVLAESLITSATTNNKISNNCTFDGADQLFRCSLVILDSDDNEESRTQSTTSIRYELEKASSGLPSEDISSLSVIVSRNG